MKKYTLFHPYVMAFYAKTIYQDVVKNWRGMGLTYLLVLAIVIGLFEISVDFYLKKVIILTSNTFLAYYYLLSVIVLFLQYLLKTFMFSIAGWIFCRVYDVALSYAALFRFTAIAITPMIFVKLLLHHFGYVLNSEMLVSMMLTLFYLLYGIRAVAQMRAK